MSQLVDVPADVRRAASLVAGALREAGESKRPIQVGTHPLGDFQLVVSEPGLGEASVLPFESHRRNIDLHVVLEGHEAYECARIEDCRLSRAYEDRDDAALYESEVATSHRIVLGPGDAVVFFPEDAHKPKIQPAGMPVDSAVAPEGSFRKAVVKIAVGGAQARKLE
ncbi:MAG: YhcH/YjgK/YiaL family protein [Rectinemataceae bacterium]